MASYTNGLIYKVTCVNQSMKEMHIYPIHICAKSKTFCEIPQNLQKQENRKSLQNFKIKMAIYSRTLGGKAINFRRKGNARPPLKKAPRNAYE